MKPSKKTNEFISAPEQGLKAYEVPIVGGYVQTVDQSLGRMFDLYSRLPKPASAPRTAGTIGTPAVANVTDLAAYRAQQAEAAAAAARTGASEQPPVPANRTAPAPINPTLNPEAAAQRSQIDAIEQTLADIYARQEQEMRNAQEAA